MPTIPDNRNPYQQDRDRILYASALSRLMNVTQVASAAEGHIFHNRYNHSIKVAQVARRTAEHLLCMNAKEEDERTAAEALATSLGGLDVDVVEAAALAHDLGHPPFGHIGEAELHKRVAAKTKGVAGFEGNAQSFRIVTRLAAHDEHPGLDLTRATLHAILKYPYPFGDPRQGTKAGKWGAYESEAVDFKFARALPPGLNSIEPGLEAAIMDWADDISYAVHDCEDFFKAGLIPLDTLAKGPNNNPELDMLLEGIVDRNKDAPYTLDALKDSWERLSFFLRNIEAPFDGSPKHRRGIRMAMSGLIGQYVQKAPSLGNLEAPLRLEITSKKEVWLLKQLTWSYVIAAPHLATQQAGQRRVIRTLFNYYYKAIHNEDFYRLPGGYQDQVKASLKHASNAEVESARLAADFVAGLTEPEATVLFQRISGINTGLLLDINNWRLG